ncbi:hypothetical protein G9A89_017583 [Geosiphon pyriformis]|nr:hypothetical protein G9A89_017583 [Geosiphon pyriformis]
MKNIAIDKKQTLCLITKELNGLSQQNYAEDTSSIIENTKHYYFPYPPSLPITFGASYLVIPVGTTYAESDFCNYINTKIDCLLGHITDTRRLGEQIYQSLLGYSTATTTRAIAETLHIIDTDIKYYVAQQFSQVQQPMEFDPEEYKNKSNTPVTVQAKFTVNKKPSVLSLTTPLYYQTFQSRIVFNLPLETQSETPQTPGNPHPWNQHTAGQTEENPSTWEQPPAQNLVESASPLTEETAILQLIGSSNKGKQPALAPREHSNTQTPIPLNITSNTPPINRIMAYRDIAKLEKFSVQALPFFLTRTTNSWYQSLAEKPTSFTEFKLAFLQYFSIKRNYYIVAQVFIQFIKRLQSSILRSVRLCHPTSLQDVVTLTCNFESAEQEVNHTQAVNLAINGTSDINPELQELTNHPNGKKITTTADTHSNRTVSNSNNLRDPIPTTATTARNLDTLLMTAEGRSWTKIKETHTRNPDISKTWNSNNNQVQTNSRPSRPIPRGPAQFRPTPTEYPNQASYLGLMEDQGFDKSMPVEGGDIEQISQPSKQTKSNIPLATITKDTTLAAIFPFDINNLNTHSLFSGAAIN